MSIEIKNLVKQKYSEIAIQADSCCGATACCDSGEVFNIMAESYTKLDGYVPDADMNLGCGIPIEYAGLKEGQSVLDLGCGAGNDLFVARAIVGESGMLTGLDFSDEMLQKAEKNRSKLGIKNMELVKGDIETMPFQSDTFDVILSNCVLNLVPNKQQAFSEMYRVLKPGGHFTISDIVLEGEISDFVKKSAELYAGCVSGAIEKKEYLDIVVNAGFSSVSIPKEREILIPDAWLKEKFGSEATLGNARVLSITLTGKKHFNQETS